MRQFFHRLLRRLFAAFRQIVKRSAFVRNVLYDAKNQGLFTSLVWHETMLADSVRVNAYRAGIARCVRPGDVVLDLGTGTGVLSYFAVRSGASKVYAIDHSAFIETARAIALHNGFHNVEFVRTNSREYTPPERVDVLIHEQLDGDLFGENMVENVLDLRRRALKPGGRVVPGAFEFFVEPLALKDAHRLPHLWEFEGLGFDMRFLKGSELVEPYKKGDYELFSIKTHFADFHLCDPEPLIRFDLATLESADDIPRRFEVSRRVARGGRLDCLCIHFRAGFDEQVALDTSPMKAQTHWENLVFRMESRHYDAGERIDYVVELPLLADRSTWRASLAAEPAKTASPAPA